MDGKPPDFYKEFDSLLHTTTFEKAYLILQNGFEPKPVGKRSATVVNSEIKLKDKKTDSPIDRLHPVRESKVIWYGPCKISDLKNLEYTVEMYGNVSFSMKRLWYHEGIVDSELKFYFVDVIKYWRKSACRILVSHEDYPTLRPYNPYTIGGPLYIDKKSKRLYYTSRLICCDGSECPNELEIMKEPNTSSLIDYNLNHRVSVFICRSDKRNIIPNWQRWTRTS